MESKFVSASGTVYAPLGRASVQRHAFCEPLVERTEQCSFAHVQIALPGQMLTLRGNARFPLLTETCSNSYHEQLSSIEISTINLEKLQTDLLYLKKTIMNLQGKMSVLPLIDNDDYSLDMNFNYTNMDIDNLQNAAASQDWVNAREHMQQIVLSSFHIFACLRRPWRYPIDINKQHALESWLDKHAVLKNSQSKIC